MARRRSREIVDTVDPGPAITLWILRILVPLGAYREFMHSRGFCNDVLAKVIGLGHWVDSSISDFEPEAVHSELRARHKKAEKQRARALLPETLCNNVAQLADLLGLSAVDCRILEFAVLIHSERILDDTADWLGSISTNKVFRALSIILSLPGSEIRASLSPRGILARSGLVSVSRSGSSTLRGKLDLISSEFADLMVSLETDPVSLLRGTVSPAAPAELGLDDYSHITPLLKILCPYLRHVCRTGRRGVNIFLHGAPGTGKSQLARVLAGELGYELFEVACEDADGGPVNGNSRLRALRAAQCFFAQRQTLLVFDEAEDVFGYGNFFFGRQETADVRKAWINRMLEENPVPTLWLSNSVCNLDPAFTRRFDMVFELPLPPKKQRERILQESCGDLIDAVSISRIAGVESLAPAVVDRASSVVRAIRDELGPKGCATALERLISNTLEAQGHRPLVQNDPNRLPEIYDPGFINADADLAGVAAGLIEARAGRLCLYGPPGTGKTAYG